ncbi:putative oxalocrotonate tautomerase enzyme-domain-containing protein, partial [Mycena galopus ATCC 62051]
LALHRIFVPAGLYTPADKAALAQATTDVYHFPPPFYIVVLFIDIEPSNFFVGEQATDRMVRISVEHIARNFSQNSDALKRHFMDRYKTALAPCNKARGIDWEVQVTDCDVGLNSFRVFVLEQLFTFDNAIALEHERHGSSRGNTEEERIWKRQNRAGGNGGLEG